MIDRLPPGQLPQRRQLRPKQGLIQAAILETLTEAEGTLSVREIHAGAESRLGRDISSDTLWCYLSAAARDPMVPLVRCSRGQYRFKN